MRIALVYALSCSLGAAAACAPSGADRHPDDTPSDAGATTADAGPASLPSVCDGTCRDFTLSATVEGNTGAFTRAQFGLTAPAQSASGQWELYVEAHAGGDPACPQENSPTPWRTLVVAGLVLPADTAARTKDDGVRASLLDFRGDLTSEPLLRATALRLVPRALEACVGCGQGDARERLFAFDLDATLPGGSVAGQVFATHCDSLDTL